MVAKTLQRVTRLAPLAEVLARITTLTKPVDPHTVNASLAVGSVLAADAVAPVRLPKTALALRDGYAVLAERVADAGAYSPIPLLPSPEWVEVGESLPDGLDAVLGPDAVTIDGGMAHAVSPAACGDGVLPGGTDAAEGEVLRRAGECLRNIDAAVLRAVRSPRVAVRVPRLRLVCANPYVSSSDDSVTPLLANAVRAQGGSAQIVRVSEQHRSLEQALTDPGADAVVTVGGTGSGRRDQAVHAVAALGVLEVHGIALTPGTSAAFARLGTRPVLLLPGRLDAATAAFLILGRHLLVRLAGRASAEPGVEVTVGRKLVSTVGLAEVLLVRQGPTGVEPIAREAFPLQALARAQGWVLVPADREGFAPGERIAMWPLP
jgi:molybdopterin molybdotransferase